MKIGIDTDGVLTDMSAFNLEFGERFLKRKPTNPDAYDVIHMFSVTTREKIRHGFRFFREYSKNCPPRECAGEIIKKLIEEGFSAYEITARVFATRKNPVGRYSRKWLLDWFRKHCFTFSEVVFCSEKNAPQQKLAACQQYGIRLMIDDKAEVANLLSQNGITVILFDAPYNRDVSGKNIIRVFDWLQVYDTVKRLHSQQSPNDTPPETTPALLMR